MTDQFKIGDKVKLKDGKADGYIQPWRSRLSSGRVGTVIGTNNSTGVMFKLRVNWDNRRGLDWTIDVDPRSLEIAE